MIIQGDCLEKLKDLEDNSVDSIITDPPYELGFMGKSWDNSGIAYNVDMWKECLRVLKPGGHLLSFGGTRTYHRMASAIEDAGFEVRDMIEWVYGSGFPKSLNIGKAVDKLQGNEREVIGKKRCGIADSPFGSCEEERKHIDETKGTSEWEGWGTALKPAHEPICMAKKPLVEKTVAENVLKYGTGGINIDECRVGTEERYNAPAGNKAGGNSLNMSAVGMPQDVDGTTAIGRFPANLIHDNSEEVRECFPETGKGNGKGVYNYAGREYDNKDTSMFNGDKPQAPSNFNDSGNASRFFKSIIYQTKASKAERNRGCEGLEEKEEVYPGINTFDESGNRLRADGSVIPPLKSKNNHPTVKPIALMEYLIKMVTPKGGIVLDPFAGSGSTLVAAKQNGFQYIGIELTEEYIPIIEARLEAVKEDRQQKLL